MRIIGFYPASFERERLFLVLAEVEGGVPRVEFQEDLRIIHLSLAIFLNFTVVKEGF